MIFTESKLSCLRRPTFDGAKVGKTPFFLANISSAAHSSITIFKKRFTITDYQKTLNYQDFFAQAKSTLYTKGCFLFWCFFIKSAKSVEKSA
jgi:hypothetical protein